MTDKLNELKQAIQKAVPEIMNIDVFGCHFIEDGNEFIVVSYKTEAICDRIIDEYGDSHFVADIDEVLGRDIQIADVLRAIEKRKLWPPYRIGTHGLFFVAKEISATSPYISAGIGWDLSKDLDGQSEETITFLHSIIC